MSIIDPKDTTITYKTIYMNLLSPKFYKIECSND